MLKNFKKKNNNKGFTLVELLVVIAIIGILAVVAVPSLMKNISRAKAADIVSYLGAVRTATISEYAADPTITGLDQTKINGLVESKPNEAGTTTSTIDTTTGAITMTITISNNTTLADEVQKQANTSFGKGIVTVSGTTPSGGNTK